MEISYNESMMEEEKVKIGGSYRIHCYKHNGKVIRSSEDTIILDETDDYLVCANNMVKIAESDGRSYTTKELAILFFYKKHWFNVIAQLKSFGLFYYCNLASPYIIDEDIIKYIDYDLDLRVYPDGGYRVLDKNEYKYHKKVMNYPETIDLILKKELKYLIEMKKNNQGHFNKDLIKYYYKRYQEIIDSVPKA